MLRAAEASLNTQLKSIVALLLLTGARVSELLHAEWRNVDVERRTWLIPMSKNGKSRYVPLSQAAIDIIEKLPRFNGVPYLIPNPETLRPYVSIKKAWSSIRKSAGLYDVRVHDLRHSFASSCVSNGVSLFTLSKLLGHSSIASSERYSHISESKLHEASEIGAAGLFHTP